MEGDTWIAVNESLIIQNNTFFTEIHLNTGSLKLAAYNVIINYDSNLIEVDTTTDGPNLFGYRVIKGTDGFVTAVNVENDTSGNPLNLKVAGFDALGKSATNDLHLFTVYWKALKPGIGNLTLTIESLIDVNYNQIGSTQRIYNASVNIISQ